MASPISLRFGDIRIDYDIKKVERGVMEDAEAVFYRIGGYITKTAKNSMKSRQGSSPEGSPPHRHPETREPLYRLLRFSVDRVSKTELVLTAGPEKFRQASRAAKAVSSSLGPKTVPAVLEDGGRVRHFYGYGRPLAQSTIAHVSKRPFMGPALKKALQSKVPKRFWQQVI